LDDVRESKLTTEEELFADLTGLDWWDWTTPEGGDSRLLACSRKGSKHFALKEVGQNGLLYLGQVEDQPASIFDNCGQNDRFPFFGRFVAAHHHVCPVRGDVALCVCSHYGLAGVQRECSLVPLDRPTGARKVSLG
jgi:hypothetical protein